jgi:hypothetical protein
MRMQLLCGKRRRLLLRELEDLAYAGSSIKYLDA